MSIVRINQDDIEVYSLRANPRVHFASSSLGITGSLPLFSDGSSTMKDLYASPGLYVSSGSAGAAIDSDVESARSAAINLISMGGNASAAQSYIDAVHAVTSSSKFAKSQEVIRFEPSVRLDPNFVRKKVIQQTLFPFYRGTYPKMQWNYTNYHTLNFVTGGNLPTNSVIIYPAGTASFDLQDQNALAPDKEFTFDFYINPRYTSENVGDSITAGTIFHMSSCYALSLVTGTRVGLDGKPSSFRLLLQLSQSAEIPPSSCRISGNTVTSPGQTIDPGFLFVSNDNTLDLNKWSHVAVRWGASVNQGTGSFNINGVDQGLFVVSSQSCMQTAITTTADLADPDALFIGNFYEGPNRDTSTIASFFNVNAAADEGVTGFGNQNLTNDPVDYTFRHPLNAEVHDLKIFKTYRSDQQILTSAMSGYAFDPLSTSLTGSQDLIFYVPPFFTKDVLPRNVLQTPFQFSSQTTTDDPFNVAMSFGVAGHELNLQNFVKEFVRGTHPRLLNLTASEIDYTTSTPQTANYFLYQSPGLRKRNITVLPCDNGYFYPNFEMLKSDGKNIATLGGPTDRFLDDFGSTDFTIIKLRDLVSTATLIKISDPSDSSTTNSSSMFSSLLTPVGVDGTIEPGVASGQVLTILQRTGDPTSNEVVIFDISNMFYGDKIRPGSVVLTDTAVTGSEGRVRITLKDDGNGSLYRADALTRHPVWTSVGNVIYEEGLIVVKSPNIPMFGADSWELSFEGHRNIHVSEINVTANKSLINSSTNPTYQNLTPTDYSNESASSFVYITGIQLHDDNLNVIGRATLAQPIIKRDSDRIVFRLRMDY